MLHHTATGMLTAGAAQALSWRHARWTPPPGAPSHGDTWLHTRRRPRARSASQATCRGAPASPEGRPHQDGAATQPLSRVVLQWREPRARDIWQPITMAIDSGKMLTQCQFALHLTQEELADLIGVSKRTIQRWQDRGCN